MFKQRPHTVSLLSMLYAGLFQGVPSAMPLSGREKEVLLQRAHGETHPATASKTKANSRYVQVCIGIHTYTVEHLMQTPICYRFVDISCNKFCFNFVAYVCIDNQIIRVSIFMDRANNENYLTTKISRWMEIFLLLALTTEIQMYII